MLYYMTYFYWILAIIGAVSEAFMIIMQVVSTAYARIYLNKTAKKSSIAMTDVQGVSIIKPLIGVDSNLEKNLETFFELDYPQFELLFCIEDEDDPAHTVVNRLIEKYPQIDTRVLSGQKKFGVNPKVNNLKSAYDVMKYNLFLISDSRVKVLPLTLLDLVSKMTDNVALVHCVPYCSNRFGFSTYVEKIYFGGQLSRIYLCAHAIGVTCMSGLVMLLRKDYCDKPTGSWKIISDYIAEDYMIGKVLQDSGYEIALSTFPALQNSGNYGMKNFISRLVRWTRIRINMTPFAVILELFSECFIVGFLFSWFCFYFFAWNMQLVFLFHVTFCFIFDYIRIRLLENGDLSISKKDYVAAWLLREILTPYVYFCALRNPTTLLWGSRRYQLKCGGKADEIEFSAGNIDV